MKRTKKNKKTGKRKKKIEGKNKTKGKKAKTYTNQANPIKHKTKQKFTCM